MSRKVISTFLILFAVTGILYASCCIQYPDPPPDPSGWVGPNCSPEGQWWYRNVSCTCPAENGGTLGGYRQLDYRCENHRWALIFSGSCRVSGQPWC